MKNPRSTEENQKNANPFSLFSGFVIKVLFLSFSYTTTYNDLLWAMLGSVEKEESEISDTRYAYVTKLGETLIILFIIAAVVVAFNMLVATMNHTYEDIMVSIYKGAFDWEIRI